MHGLRQVHIRRPRASRSSHALRQAEFFTLNMRINRTFGFVNKGGAAGRQTVGIRRMRTGQWRRSGAAGARAGHDSSGGGGPGGGGGGGGQRGRAARLGGGERPKRNTRERVAVYQRLNNVNLSPRSAIFLATVWLVAKCRGQFGGFGGGGGSTTRATAGSTLTCA